MREETAKEIARLKTIEPVFETDGWRELAKQFEEAVEEYKEALTAAENVEQLYYLRGQIDHARAVLNLSSAVPNLIAHFEEEELFYAEDV